jgi:hypothetical protein
MNHFGWYVKSILFGGKCGYLISLVLLVYTFYFSISYQPVSIAEYMKDSRPSQINIKENHLIINELQFYDLRINSVNYLQSQEQSMPSVDKPSNNPEKGTVLHSSKAKLIVIRITFFKIRLCRG